MEKSMGSRIKDVLKSNGITQEELSNETKIPLRTISNIVGNKSEPSVYKVKAIAEYLNIDLNLLITGKAYTPARGHFLSIRIRIKNFIRELF